MLGRKWWSSQVLKERTHWGEVTVGVYQFIYLGKCSLGLCCNIMTGKRIENVYEGLSLLQIGHSGGVCSGV